MRNGEWGIVLLEDDYNVVFSYQLSIINYQLEKQPNTNKYCIETDH